MSSPLKYALAFIVSLTAVAFVALDLQASSRSSSCRRTEAPLPPGDYSIVVAGSDEKDVAAAIRRVVAEEHRLRPGIFANTNIEVYDGAIPPPTGQRAIATIMVGTTESKSSQGDRGLNIFVPKIYEKNDPQYVKGIKLGTAGIHLALRSLLFFSGESKATDDTMGSEHFSSLPDDFVEGHHD
jgi:hypothetical protein